MKFVGVDPNYFGISEALAVYFFRNINEYESLVLKE